MFHFPRRPIDAVIRTRDIDIKNRGGWVSEFPLILSVFLMNVMSF